MTKRQSEWNKRKHEIHRNIQATIVLVILHQCNRLNQLHQLSPRRLIILENACDIKYTRLSTCLILSFMELNLDEGNKNVEIFFSNVLRLEILK